MLGRRFPAVERMLLEATDGIAAFAELSARHWKKIWSTNPLERLNRMAHSPPRPQTIWPNPCCTPPWPRRSHTNPQLADST
jgi:putative transposase